MTAELADIAARRDDYIVEHWRGPRDVRQWPTKLTRNAGNWMWTPTLPPPQQGAA